MKRFFFLFVLPLMLSTCYRESGVEVPEWEVFDLTLSRETVDFLMNSHDTSYTLEDPVLEFALDGQHVYVKDLSLRGRSSLDFRRKSFSVRLDFPIYMQGAGGHGIKRLSRFKLNSLCMDYTYINNRLAFGIFQQAGIMPLFFKYVELRINGASQGVYLLIEDPEERSRELGSEFILRRDYHHGISDSEYSPRGGDVSPDEYRERFREIYDSLSHLEGEALYAFLRERINLEQYYRKMAIDYLLQNGDYTDELFLYAKILGGGIQYQLIPWDYDDIFSSRPHEVGRDWGIGNVFGPRSYSSPSAVLDEIGNRLVFSIEDDLDYIIATDDYLYLTYEQELANLLSILDPSLFQTLTEEIQSELGPFYEQDEIIDQSRYDQRATSRELWQQNLQDRHDFLLTRLASMKSQLTNQE